MTNYEWLKNNEDMGLKAFLIENLCIIDNEIRLCRDIFQCSQCKFKHPEKSCFVTTAEWLDAEHEPSYKKGDIVIIDCDTPVWIFVKETDDGYAILTQTATAVENNCGIDFSIKISDIKKKIGNIYEEKEEPNNIPKSHPIDEILRRADAVTERLKNNASYIYTDKTIVK